MDASAASLNEIIGVLEDGRDFYADAARHIEHTDTRTLFERMAQTKQAIVDELRARVASRGEHPIEHGTMRGAVRRAYAELRVALSTDPEAEYIAQLEAFEDRIVHAFQDVIFDSDDPEVRAVVLKHMPSVARDHTDMAALKHGTPH
jgi:uncharacterized protein (TIGR02284 family)